MYGVSPSPIVIFRHTKNNASQSADIAILWIFIVNEIASTTDYLEEVELRSI